MVDYFYFITEDVSAVRGFDINVNLKSLLIRRSLVASCQFYQLVATYLLSFVETPRKFIKFNIYLFNKLIFYNI